MYMDQSCSPLQLLLLAAIIIVVVTTIAAAATSLLSPQGPQPLLQRVLLLGRRLVGGGLGVDRLGLAGLGGVELAVERDAGVVG